MRGLLVSLIATAAAVVATVGTKLALDMAVAPAPWFVVTFAGVLLTAWAVGPSAGLLAGAAIVLADLAGIPARPGIGARLEAAGPIVELVTVVLAVTMATVIRGTIARERRSRAVAAVASRATADLDRRWHVVADAIPEFATLATPLQVEDALVRHATTLVGRPIRLDRTAPAGSDEADRQAVAVVDHDQVVGVLSLDATADEHDAAAGAETGLDPEDRLGLLALATLAGGALERIRLRSATGSSVQSAERSGQRLRRLHDLTTQLAALVTPESIGEVVVRDVLDTLRAPVGLFYLKDGAGDLRLAHARGYPIGLAGHDARLAQSDRLPAADALRDGRAIVVPTPAEWRRLYPGASDRLGITGTRSVIAWPIGSPPAAVLVVQRTVEGSPSTDEVSQLELAGHQALQAIERARIYAQEREARQLQEAFVGVMSHELRTPITTILAGSKLLTRDRAMGERSRDLAADIEAEADRLFRLVEDLLVLTRLERGSLSVGDEPVHLARVLQRVVDSEAPRWPDTRFELPEDRTSHLVRGDETYCEQVLRNLLTNAAKYSPAGSVVRVQVETTDGEVAVRVLDQGTGVTDAEVERLFGLFYRSPTTAASAAGAGIGLFVCRRLVAAMGGRVWARSRPEGGSEFGFSLQHYPEDELDLEPDRDDAVEGERVRNRAVPVFAGARAGSPQTVDNGSPSRGDAR